MFDREQYILKDSPLKNNLLKLFKKNDKLTILDIGGCEGEESIRYSRIFPSSNIYIFEPLPDNQNLVLENLEKYKVDNIKLLPFAVSDIDGISQFHVSSGKPQNQDKELNWDFGNKSSSLLLPNVKNINSWLRFDSKIDVQTITLKTFLESNEIFEIDFIHMDVQGAEMKVFLGAKDFIKKIKAIWLEVSDVELYNSQPLRIDIEKFMKINGFYLVKSQIESSFGDQFYVNKIYFKIFSFFSIIKIFQK